MIDERRNHRVSYAHAGMSESEHKQAKPAQKGGKSDVENPDIDPSAFIAPSADIYGDVSIAENCSIWFHATVRAGAGSVSIGAGTNVQDNCVIHVDRGYSVTVGKNVTIGHSAIVHGCSVGDNTLIGMGAIILNGASVGKIVSLEQERW